MHTHYRVKVENELNKVKTINVNATRHYSNKKISNDRFIIRTPCSK